MGGVQGRGETVGTVPLLCLMGGGRRVGEVCRAQGLSCEMRQQKVREDSTKFWEVRGGWQSWEEEMDVDSPILSSVDLPGLALGWAWEAGRALAGHCHPPRSGGARAAVRRCRGVTVPHLGG